MATALIPVPTTLAGPSSLSALVPNPRYLYSGHDVGSTINNEELLAQKASLILGIAGVRRGSDYGKRAKHGSATTVNT